MSSGAGKRFACAIAVALVWQAGVSEANRSEAHDGQKKHERRPGVLDRHLDIEDKPQSFKNADAPNGLDDNFDTQNKAQENDVHVDNLATSWPNIIGVHPLPPGWGAVQNKPVNDLRLPIPPASNESLINFREATEDAQTQTLNSLREQIGGPQSLIDEYQNDSPVISKAAAPQGQMGGLMMMPMMVPGLVRPGKMGLPTELLATAYSVRESRTSSGANDHELIAELGARPHTGSALQKDQDIASVNAGGKFGIVSAKNISTKASSNQEDSRSFANATEDSLNQADSQSSPKDNVPQGKKPCPDWVPEHYQNLLSTVRTLLNQIKTLEVQLVNSGCIGARPESDGTIEQLLAHSAKAVGYALGHQVYAQVKANLGNCRVGVDKEYKKTNIAHEQAVNDFNAFLRRMRGWTDFDC